MRLLTIIKIIGAVFLAGTPGSLELDRITMYEACLQITIGILLLCGGIYIDEIKRNAQQQRQLQLGNDANHEKAS